MAPKISIVVPAYNEAARLGATLRAIVAYLIDQRAESELIVVDDGSSDNTAPIAEQSLADCGAVATRVIRYEKNRGKVMRPGRVCLRPTRTSLCSLMPICRRRY